jgi:SPP1 family predicted phage head-tail adaptor
MIDSPVQLNKRVEFQEKPSTKNSFGEQSDDWTPVVTLWANIRPLSSREVIAAQATQAETTHEITIRYRAGIEAKMRGVYGARVFDLGPPVNVGERNVWLVFPATEGVSNG